MADVKPIPDEYPHVTPYLIVDGAAAAIDYYVKALGATERMRMPGPDGMIGHAEIAFGSGVVMLSDAFPEMSYRGAKAIGETPVGIHVYVEDVDAVFERAVAEGGTAVEEPSDKFYGDRSATIVDPFGHRWHLSTHVEDVAPDEMERRLAEMMGGPAG